jgi:hypothetical protein
MSRGMLLSGAFTEADFAEILESVRTIEQRAPDKLYHATFTDVPGGDSDDQAQATDAALAHLHRIFPRLRERQPHNLKITIETVAMLLDALRLYLATYADRMGASPPSAIEEMLVISAARAALAAAEPGAPGSAAEGDRA